MNDIDAAINCISNPDISVDKVIELRKIIENDRRHKMQIKLLASVVIGIALIVNDMKLPILAVNRLYDLIQLILVRLAPQQAAMFFGIFLFHVTIILFIYAFITRVIDISANRKSKQHNDKYAEGVDL